MSMKTKTVLLISLIAAASLVSAGAAAPVKTEGGLVEGTVADGLTIYRGIPFGAPPVGDLRWRPPQPAAKWPWKSPALQGKLRSPHTAEIPFVFDNTDIPKYMTAHAKQEQELAARMSGAWIQFARSGTPDHKSIPAWPKYDFEKRATMIFDTTCHVVDDPDSEARELWAGV